MPVNTVHKDYNTWRPTWDKCRVFFAGEDAVKKKGEAYLKAPGGMDATKGVGKSRYARFKYMAKFFPAVSRSIEGYEGLVFRNDLAVNVHENLLPVIENMTFTGVSLNAFARRILVERALVGRYGELVDYIPGDGSGIGLSFSKGYKAEDIINWREVHMNGKPHLVLVVLTEEREKPPEEYDSDGFSVETYTSYRVLDLGDDPQNNPAYRVREFRIDGVAGQRQVGEDRYPTFMGDPIKEIPFKFHGVRENSPSIERPPSLDMVNLVQHDYHNSADQQWLLHMCSIPQHWRAGFDDVEGGVIELGGSVVWNASKPDAKAGVSEPSGQSHGAFEKTIKDNRGEMAQLGASLLEQEKGGVEASDTHRIRHSNRTSFLQAMVEVQSEGHTATLKWHGMFMGLSPNDIDAISAELNKDYFAVAIDHNQMQGLMEMYLGGRITKHTLFERLQAGEIISSNETFDTYEEVLTEENAGLGDEVL